jgi:hypothetical protein
MDPYAIPADLEAIWRPLSAAETTVAVARIAQASRKIRGDVPLVDGLTVDQRIGLGFLDVELVKDVVVEMVRRVMLMGDYVRQQSVTVDDATKSSTYDVGVSSGVMFIADTEMGTLTGRVVLSGAFEIALGGL